MIKTTTAVCEKYYIKWNPLKTNAVKKETLIYLLKN